MKTEAWLNLIPLVVSAVVFQFTPLLTRRGLFFSATVDPEFPGTDDGRRVLRSYRVQVGLWAAACCVLAAILGPGHPALGVVLPLLVMITGVVVIYASKFREVHNRFGLRRPEIREASLGQADRESSSLYWWCVPPFLALGAVAWYLSAHWNQLPAQFPVHWRMNGEPNRWATRDGLGVYGALLTGAGFNLLFVAMTWAFSHARASMMRYVSMRLMVVMQYPMTFAFVMVALLPLYRTPIWVVPVVMFVFAGGVIYWSYRKITAQPGRGEIPEPQSDSYWKAGVFYYNPNDPAIFVAKRVGIGYTMNFANKMSWLVMAGVVVLVLLPPILLRGK